MKFALARQACVMWMMPASFVARGVFARRLMVIGEERDTTWEFRGRSAYSITIAPLTPELYLPYSIVPSIIFGLRCGRRSQQLLCFVGRVDSIHFFRKRTSFSCCEPVDAGYVRVDIHAVFLCYSKPNKHCSQSQYSFLPLTLFFQTRWLSCLNVAQSLHLKWASSLSQCQQRLIELRILAI